MPISNIFGTLYEQWRNWAGEGYELLLNQLLSKADSESTCLVWRKMWKTEDELQFITLMAEVRGLKATVAKVNQQYKPMSKTADVKPLTSSFVLKPKILIPPQTGSKAMHYGRRLLPKLVMKRSQRKEKLHWWCALCKLWNITHTTDKHVSKGNHTWWESLPSCQGFLEKAFALPVPSLLADCSLVALHLAPCLSHACPSQCPNLSQIPITDTTRKNRRKRIPAYPCRLMIYSCIMLNMQWVNMT